MVLLAIVGFVGVYELDEVIHGYKDDVTVAKSIQQLDSVIQQNASSSEEMASTAEELSSQSEMLSEMVVSFVVENHGQGSVIQETYSPMSARKEQPRLSHFEKGSVSVDPVDVNGSADAQDNDFEEY